MKYVSTRGLKDSLPFSKALEQGLAPDGGLYVPETYPRLSRLEPEPSCVLAPYLEGDALSPALEEMVQAAFSFPLPLQELKKDTAVLELFHGPTAAFKDVGARFLAECVARLPTRYERLVLVATSGDTGGAVAAAFHGKPRIQVAILFPKDRVSPRQERQLTHWGKNVRAFAVRGSFDDCQRLVKEAFQNQELRRRRWLLSANSINLGRLLPQQIYYAQASQAYFKKQGVAPGFIIPTGNLGNAVACLWAKRLGFPISQVVLATNRNRTLWDYFQSGRWAPRPSVPTLANAMDVGNPSNMERLLHLYPHPTALKQDVSVVSVDDEAISQTIARGEQKWGILVCPHTAAALYVREQLAQGHWIVVATAHPAKFEEVVEPLVGHPVPVPASLNEILTGKGHAIEIEPRLESLMSLLLLGP